MRVGGSMVNGCKLRRREGTDGCMRVGTREKDGERGEEFWGIIETVDDIVFGGGDGCRAHVWWTEMMLWEGKKEREDVVWSVVVSEKAAAGFTSQIELANSLIIYIHWPFDRTQLVTSPHHSRLVPFFACRISTSLFHPPVPET
jgi:hypothetical protein